MYNLFLLVLTPDIRAMNFTIKVGFSEYHNHAFTFSQISMGLKKRFLNILYMFIILLYWPQPKACAPGQGGMHYTT